MGAKTDELLQKIADRYAHPGEYARFAHEHESAIQAAATAGLVVRPDTVAAITLYNAEPAGGKSLIIDRIFTHNLVSTAAQAFFGLWYCVHPRMTEPTNDITTLRGTGDGSPPNTGIVIVDVGATVLDNGWFPVGSGNDTEATGVLPGSHADWEAMGRLVVPPLGGISVQVLSAVVGDTFTSGLSWWRHQL